MVFCFFCYIGFNDFRVIRNHITEIKSHQLILNRSKLERFLYIITKLEKENIQFGIRTIIEAIQAGTAVDKGFIQKTNRI